MGRSNLMEAHACLIVKMRVAGTLHYAWTVRGLWFESFDFRDWWKRQPNHSVLLDCECCELLTPWIQTQNRAGRFTLFVCLFGRHIDVKTYNLFELICLFLLEH